jgi:radical SAM/Cys-rich protein
MEGFSETLSRHSLALERGTTTTLQVNVGRLCNQSCRHCHLNAGPGREEIMSRRTVDDVIAYASRGAFTTVDVTGGAPELLPDLPHLLQGMSSIPGNLVLRTNLTALRGDRLDSLVQLCSRLGVTLIASFPSLSGSQADAQRGDGTWDRSLETLRKLNSCGYGMPGTGLELNLVVNPAGAFLPPGQCQLQERYRRDLKRRWDISFNTLYSFANVPLGRFRNWLIRSGNYEQYMNKLSGSFNPATLTGLMCRSLVSVSWDGHLYDCDFNQAAGLCLGGSPVHVSAADSPPAPGTPVAVGDHCFACTAGTGFT